MDARCSWTIGREKEFQEFMEINWKKKLKKSEPKKTMFDIIRGHSEF